MARRGILLTVAAIIAALGTLLVFCVRERVPTIVLRPPSRQSTCCVP